MKLTVQLSVPLPDDFEPPKLLAALNSIIPSPLPASLCITLTMPNVLSLSWEEDLANPAAVAQRLLALVTSEMPAAHNAFRQEPETPT